MEDLAVDIQCERGVCRRVAAVSSFIDYDIAIDS